MGKVMSMLTRKVNRFNVESRAHRVLERDKPTPAPKYESNLRDMQRALDLDPELVDKLNTKDAELDSRLKNVYVTSKDSFIDYAAERSAASPDKPLPLDRATPDQFEYGYMEPLRIAPGRCSLRQAMKFITDHQSDPEVWTKQKIAADYQLKEESVENVLKYFKSFSVYIPDMGQKERILTQASRNFLEDKKD